MLKAKWTKVTPAPEEPTVRPKPDKPADTTLKKTAVPNTRDDTNIPLWLLVFILSTVCGMSSLFVLKAQNK